MEWSIRAGGSVVFTSDEVGCRDVFKSYGEWWGYRMQNEPGEVVAGVLANLTGLHPKNWNLPVELVDPTGAMKKIIK